MEYVILALGWLGWASAFARARRSLRPPSELDRRARWGIAIEAVAYFLLWQGRFWARPSEGWRTALAAAFLLLAGVLAWTAVLALGRHWRIDAGLSADHELIRGGPYRLVRHPIYASMLCLLCGTGLVISAWPLLLLSLFVFVIGTEIRVRVEDRLLAARFGSLFEEYRRSTPAYIPYIR